MHQRLNDLICLRQTPATKFQMRRVYIRVEATLIGAYAEIQRRSGCWGEAVLDRAGAQFGVSKNTARNRLKLLTETQGCSDIWKGLKALFEGWTTRELTAYLAREDSD